MIGPDALPRPAFGEACNGCGLCCVLECCPLAIVLFRRRKGPCPALKREEGGLRYRCSIVTSPRRYLRWLPEGWGRRLALRWIAAGSGCDCSAEVVDDVSRML